MKTMMQERMPPMERLRDAIRRQITIELKEMNPDYETPMEKLRGAMRRQWADDYYSTEGQHHVRPSHLTEVVTLKSRPLTRLEWKTARAKDYPRVQFAEHFWSKEMVEWLDDPFNVAEYWIGGSVCDERVDEELSRAWIELRFAFPDIETAALFKLRWKRPNE